MSSPLASYANKLPATVRKRILDEDMLNTATPAYQDEKMLYLFAAWYNYVDKKTQKEFEEDFTCPKCRETTLGYFKQLEPDMKMLASVDNILKQLI